MTPQQLAKVFCYDGQSEAVRDLLRNIGAVATAIHVVAKPEQLRGHEKFVFVHVKNHPQVIHAELWAMLENRHAVVVEIDNSRVPLISKAPEPQP